MQKLKIKDQNYKSKIKIFKNFTFYIVILIFTLYTLHLFLSPVYAADPPCNPTIPGDCPAGLDQIEQMVGNVISLIVGVGFIAMLVMIVMTGFKYLTSGGEPKAIQSAHMTLTFALLGVVLLAIAWLLLQLVAGFTGVNITVFDIKVLCKGPGGLQFCPSPSPGP